MSRRQRAIALLLPIAFGSVALACGAQDRRAGSAADNSPSGLYQRGMYDQAIAAAAPSPGAPAASARDAVILVRALSDVGRPSEAIERVGPWRTDPTVAPAIAGALEMMGRLDAAAEAWGIAARGTDSVRAQVEQLRLRSDRLGGDSAVTLLDRWNRRIEARGGARTASEFQAMAVAARLLGRADPQQFKAALRLYDRALALEPTRLDARVELGELFLEKFNFADARTSLEQVLSVNPRHPRALAALVRLNAAEGRGAPRDPLQQLLAVNPNSAVGHALAARRLIDAEQYDAAVAEARRGLVVDSTAIAPWVEIAAARWLALDTAGHLAALARAHHRLPGSAEAEASLAEVSARNRLYRDAVRFARAGVLRDGRDAHARAQLGINLLRVGQAVAGRATLDSAFALDPYDVRVKNTLDLLDSYSQARTVSTAHFDFIIEPGDADLMALYAGPLAEDAYAALTTRYGYAPTERVRVEFFRSHADFSVRAVGLAGLGALGVAFGNVLAIDAPPARSRGDFNWASVLWHEFAHTITLGMTDNRVPRWVSEGLSVLEERRARPEWGGTVTPALIAAYGAGRLRPVSRLNDGFVHPRYDQEVGLSYALSAYVFEMLEQRQGISGIRQLLTGYRSGGKTPQLMQQVFGLDTAALDSTFDAWFRAKFAREFAAVRGEVRTSASGETSTELAGPLRDALTAAATATERKQWPQVVQAARRAVSLFPAWAEPGSGHHFLMIAHDATGDTAGARDALAAITARNGDAVDENITLAGLHEAARDSAAAIAALERATLADPFDGKTQAKLGDLAFARREWPSAVRARKAVVALGPTDRADALYRLAQALAGAGDMTAARQEVLRALDLAPNFEAAQDLLLTIRSREGPMTLRRRLWIVALLSLPLLALPAQRFRRASPGETPNPNVRYDGRFTFVRIRFDPLGGGRDLKWDHDYPTAETHLMKILDEVSTMKPQLEGTNILSFADSALFQYPVAYVSEPGFWTMTPEELAGVQAYVHKGGFLIFDDFAGRHWLNFEEQWRTAFPTLVPVKLDTSHPIFDSFFRIEDLEMSHPNFGVKSEFWGAYEDNDPAKRLVMIANFNNDIGDYMEFSDQGLLPIPLTNQAYKLGVNYVVYALTH